MKKILCVAIALMLMASCLVVAFAAETVEVSGSHVTGKRGETVTVEVTASEATFATWLMTVEYDATALTLDSITCNSTLFPAAFGNAASGKVTAVTFPPVNVNITPDNNVLFTATFTINETAEGGVYPINIVVDNVTDENQNELDVTVNAGSVTVDVPHVHEYTAVVTEPDCLNGGYTTYTCACGDSYVADETPALGHLWGEWVDGEGNACVGLVQVRTCERCGETESNSVGGAGHQYDDGVVTTEPTCGKSGVKTFTCSVCGDSYNEEIPATGLHTVEDWTVVSEPDCVNKGTKVGYCTVCGMSVDEDIDALGHDFVEAYTYNDEGHWHECSRCDVTTDLEAHLHDELVEEKAPTETEEGWKTYKCVCGHLSTSSVPPTGDGNTVIIAAVGALAAVAGAAYVTMKRKSF